MHIILCDLSRHLDNYGEMMWGNSGERNDRSSWIVVLFINLPIKYMVNVIPREAKPITRGCILQIYLGICNCGAKSGTDPPHPPLILTFFVRELRVRLLCRGVLGVFVIKWRICSIFCRSVSTTSL